MGVGVGRPRTADYRLAKIDRYTAVVQRQARLVPYASKTTVQRVGCWVLNRERKTTGARVIDQKPGRHSLRKEQNEAHDPHDYRAAWKRLNKSTSRG